MSHLNDFHHPIVTQEYAVYTPPMDRMIQTIGDWIDQRITGGHIYGGSRFGKSRAIKWHLRTELEKRFHTSLPLVTWIRRESKMTETDFWNTLLLASKYKFCNPEKPKTKVAAKFLLEQQFATLSRISSDNYVVLLIDEAQAMTLPEWKWLLGLQNVLDDQGIRFSVISIGSYGLQYQPDYLARTGNAHISARFFVRDAKFHGIGSENELGYVLNCYDVDSDWPVKSGISYLQYCVPKLFEQGNRLQDSKQSLWRAFEQLLPKAKKDKKGEQPEIPMLFVAHAIEKALCRLADGEDWEKVTAYESWLRIVDNIGFTNLMRTIR